MSIITRRGNRFHAGNVPIAFAGADCYQLTKGGLTQYQQGLLLDAMQQYGISVARVWAHGESTATSNPSIDTLQYGATGGLWNEAALKVIDSALAAANARNMKLILTLANNFSAYGGKATYAAWANAANASTTTQALNSGTPYTSVTVAALPNALGSGTQLSVAGSPAENIVLSAPAAQGATTISITSFTPTVTHASGSAITTTYAPDDFAYIPQIIAMYEAWIAHIINRVNTVDGIPYIVHPAIFAWECGNEMRFGGTTASGAETNANTLTSKYLGIMVAWFTAIGGYIKSLDPNHLLGSGGIANFYDYVAGNPLHNGTSAYGMDFYQITQVPYIDYMDYHCYPANTYTSSGSDCSLKWATADSYHSDMALIAYDAAQLNKPLVLGEIGIDKRSTVTSPVLMYPRQAYMAGILAEMERYGLGGAMLWNWGADTNFGIWTTIANTAPLNVGDDDAIARTFGDWQKQYNRYTLMFRGPGAGNEFPP